MFYVCQDDNENHVNSVKDSLCKMETKINEIVDEFNRLCEIEFKGDKGPQGPQGPQGPKGPKGDETIHVGNTAPTNEGVLVWIDPSTPMGDEDLKELLDGANIDYNGVEHSSIRQAINSDIKFLLEEIKKNGN